MHWSFFSPIFWLSWEFRTARIGNKAGHPGSPLFVGLWHFEPFNKITWSKCTRRQFTVSAVAVMSFSGLQEVVLSTHPGNPHAHALGLPWCSLTGCFHCRWCAVRPSTCISRIIVGFKAVAPCPCPGSCSGPLDSSLDHKR